MSLSYSAKFLREYKKLDLKAKKQAEKMVAIFEKDHFDGRLKTHALTGRLGGYYAFSIDQKLRIIFEFRKKNVWLLSVGSHDIYKH